MWVISLFITRNQRSSLRKFPKAGNGGKFSHREYKEGNVAKHEDYLVCDVGNCEDIILGKGLFLISSF